MKRIGFLSDHWERGKVSQALDDVCASHEQYRLETIDDFHRVESVAQAVWGLINLADVIVAYLSKDSRHLYYEVGLAHGAGKPVIIVAESFASLPVDVLGQRVITVDSSTDSADNIAFRLREALKEVDRKGTSFTGYRGPREIGHQHSPHGQYQGKIGDFRALFAYEGLARVRRFERWFADAANGVPGWEVIEPDELHGNDNGFDFVIWNSRDDSELAALGNPIAVELKAIRTMDSHILSRFLHRSRVSGLKAVVLATTGTNDARTKKLLARLRKDEGIKAIALDRDDLLQVSKPEDLVAIFKQKIRELLYRGEF